MASRPLLFLRLWQCSLWWQCHKPWRAHCMICCWRDHLQVQTPTYHHRPSDAIWTLSSCCFQLLLPEKVLECPFLVLLLYSFWFLLHNCQKVIVKNGIHRCAICFHWPFNYMLEPFHLSFSFLGSSLELLHLIYLLSWSQVLVIGEFADFPFLLSTPTTKECSKVRAVLVARRPLTSTSHFCPFFCCAHCSST